MKKAGIFLLASVCASGLVAGCTAPADAGAPIPESKPVTQEQLSQMPPEAQRAAQNAQKAGDFQSQRMQEMADAQKRAQAGK